MQSAETIRLATRIKFTLNLGHFFLQFFKGANLILFKGNNSFQQGIKVLDNAPMKNIHSLI